MNAPGKFNGQYFYIRLTHLIYKKGDVLTNPNGVELLVVKTYRSRWWKILRWLGFKVKSPNTLKVKYK